MNTSQRRASTLLIATAVALSGTALAPAYAKDAPGPARSAARWQAGQLTNGVIHNDQYAFDDYGLTIDTLLALDAAEVRPKARQRIVRKLRANVGSYISDGEGGGFAGSTAKMLVAATTAHARPRHFGGVNLVHRTRGLIVDTGPEKGRLKDSTAADYSNLLAQAYALHGLAEVGVAEPSVKTFLLKQQCDAGSFRISYNDVDTNPSLRCDTAKPADRRPDLDATAIALQSMLVARDAGVDGLGRPIHRAAAWLRAEQRPNGAFRSGATAAANSNSTGLAGQALAHAGRTAAARRAAVWIANRQATKRRAAGTELRTDIGAVAFDSAALQRGRQQGIKTTADQWRRATAQAVLGLSELQTARFKVETSTRKVRPGKRIRVRASRLVPGEQYVVAIAGKVRKYGRANAKGEASALVRVPRSTKPGRRTIAVRGAVAARAGKTKIRVRKPGQRASGATGTTNAAFSVANARARNGYPGKCTRKTRRGRKGVTVVVDFRKLGTFRKHKGKTVVRCAPARFTKKGKVKKRTGIQVLRQAGIRVKGTRMSGSSVVCRLNGRPAGAEKLHLRGSGNYREKCIRTPPAAAYWSYWHSGPGRGGWRYSKVGAANRFAKPGGFEGWAFSLNAKRGKAPKPRVRPRR